MRKYKEIVIEEILDFPSTNSGLTQKFIFNNNGNVPVYASRKDGEPIGFIEDNLKGIKYYENCLGYNRNGSVGNTFHHKEKFTCGEDHRPIIIKEIYNTQLDYGYLAYKIQEAIFNNGYNWANKAGKEKVQRLSISIPLDENGNFDMKKQKDIFLQHNKHETIKNKLQMCYEKLENTKLQFNDEYKYTYLDIKEIFKPHKGNSKYTNKYTQENFGDYPLYSSKTTDFGLFGKINAYDWDINEGISWTTDGIYAGTCFIRSGKFSMTSHCGLLVPSEEFYNYNLNIEYIRIVIENVFLENAAGVDGQNKRVTMNVIKKIKIPVPIDNNGEISILLQKEISEKIKKINNEKNKVTRLLLNALNSNINYQFD